MQRVLVAEDDEPVARMLAAVLEYLGYEILVVASYEQAVTVASSFRPWVVLVGLDGRGDFAPGWRAATVLKRIAPGACLIMVATSDRAVEEVGVTPRGRLFVAALRKPFSVSQLTDQLESIGAGSRDGADSAVTEGGDAGSTPSPGCAAVL